MYNSPKLARANDICRKIIFNGKWGRESIGVEYKLTGTLDGALFSFLRQCGLVT